MATMRPYERLQSVIDECFEVPLSATDVQEMLAVAKALEARLLGLQVQDGEVALAAGEDPVTRSPAKADDEAVTESDSDATIDENEVTGERGRRDDANMQHDGAESRRTVAQDETQLLPRGDADIEAAAPCQQVPTRPYGSATENPRPAGAAETQAVLDDGSTQLLDAGMPPLEPAPPPEHAPVPETQAMDDAGIRGWISRARRALPTFFDRASQRAHGADTETQPLPSTVPGQVSLLVDDASTQPLVVLPAAGEVPGASRGRRAQLAAASSPSVRDQVHAPGTRRTMATRRMPVLDAGDMDAVVTDAVGMGAGRMGADVTDARVLDTCPMDADTQLLGGEGMPVGAVTATSGALAGTATTTAAVEDDAATQQMPAGMPVMETQALGALAMETQVPAGIAAEVQVPAGTVAMETQVLGDEVARGDEGGTVADGSVGVDGRGSQTPPGKADAVTAAETETVGYRQGRRATRGGRPGAIPRVQGGSKEEKGEASSPHARGSKRRRERAGLVSNTQEGASANEGVPPGDVLPGVVADHDGDNDAEARGLAAGVEASGAGSAHAAATAGGSAPVMTTLGADGSGGDVQAGVADHGEGAPLCATGAKEGAGVSTTTRGIGGLRGDAGVAAELGAHEVGEAGPPTTAASRLQEEAHGLFQGTARRLADRDLVLDDATPTSPEHGVKGPSLAAASNASLAAASQRGRKRGQPSPVSSTRGGGDGGSGRPPRVSLGGGGGMDASASSGSASQDLRAVGQALDIVDRLLMCDSQVPAGSGPISGCRVLLDALVGGGGGGGGGSSGSETSPAGAFGRSAAVRAPPGRSPLAARHQLSYAGGGAGARPSASGSPPPVPLAVPRGGVDAGARDVPASDGLLDKRDGRIAADGDSGIDSHVDGSHRDGHDGRVDTHDGRVDSQAGRHATRTVDRPGPGGPVDGVGGGQKSPEAEDDGEDLAGQAGVNNRGLREEVNDRESLMGKGEEEAPTVDLRASGGSQQRGEALPVKVPQAMDADASGQAEGPHGVNHGADDGVHDGDMRGDDGADVACVQTGEDGDVPAHSGKRGRPRKRSVAKPADLDGGEAGGATRDEETGAHAHGQDAFAVEEAIVSPPTKRAHRGAKSSAESLPTTPAAERIPPVPATSQLAVSQGERAGNGAPVGEPQDWSAHPPRSLALTPLRPTKQPAATAATPGSAGMPSSRRLRDATLAPAPLRVVFGSSSAAPGSKKMSRMESTIRSIGGTVSDAVDDTTTHLVVGKFSRTIKILHAVARGSVAVVGEAWVEECGVAGAAVLLRPEHSSEIPELGKMESQYKFSLLASLDKARQRRVLAGHTFYLGEGLTPSSEDMASLIGAAGGTVARHMAELAPSEPSHIILAAHDNKGRVRDASISGAAKAIS
eukprot:jgi/Mesvir1/23501/Mv22343-RA.1